MAGMSLFQAIKNIGHYINASAAIVVNGNPAQSLTVIGVTGTDGKTTTSTLIYSILKEANYEVALIHAVAAFIGDKHIDTGFHVTSPTPWALQGLLRKKLNKTATRTWCLKQPLMVWISIDF